MDQLSLFPESGDTALLAETNLGPAANNLASVHQKIYECPSHGRYYFKYVCSLGHKIAIQRWIPGGNTHNRIARSRAAKVRSWIKAGVSPIEIDSRIKTWSAQRRSLTTLP